MSRRLLPWLPPVLAVAVYLNTLGADFTLDDIEIVRENPRTRSLDLGAIYSTDYWDAWKYADHTLYRPFTITTYALQRALNGTNPVAYHVLNVGLHALVTLLLFLLVRDLFSRRVALLAAVLFAVHAIHTEAVAGIVGRAEILALGGTLLCCLAYFRAARGGGAGWIAVSVAAYFLGVTSKETGIVAPAVILATEALLPARRWLLRRDRRALGVFVAYAAVTLVFLALRARAVEGGGVHAALAGATSGQRILTALRVGADYVRLLLAPVGLSADYPAGSVAVGGGVDARVIRAALLLVAAGWLLVRGRRRHPAVAWGTAVYLVTLFPVSNLPFAIGVTKAERLLYAPSAGFLVAAAGVLDALMRTETRRRVMTGVVAAVALTLAVLTWQRNGDWRDDCALAEATVQAAPESPIFLTRHAACLDAAGRTQEAREMLRRALRAQAGFPTALLTLGIVERREGNLSAALEPLERLLAREPDHVTALEEAGWCYYRLQRFREAAAAYGRLRELSPDDPVPYSYLMASFAAMGDVKRADAAAREALRRFPGNAQIRANAEQVRRALSP